MTNPVDLHPRENITADHLLGGRLCYRQPRDGLRATIDPILLAAAIPARPGESVLEGGTGAGAALLCLASRVPGIGGIGIDRDANLLRLAQENAAANGLRGLAFVAADIAATPTGARFDHAFANPPYHAADGTPSPSPAREAAKRASTGLLTVWARTLAASLRHRGTLTFILPAGLLETALTAMREGGAPCECVFPIRSKQGQKARLILLRGRRLGRAPLVLAAGLTLHTATGAFHPDADAILRDGAALRLTGA